MPFKIIEGWIIAERQSIRAGSQATRMAMSCGNARRPVLRRCAGPAFVDWLDGGLRVLRNDRTGLGGGHPGSGSTGLLVRERVRWAGGGVGCCRSHHSAINAASAVTACSRSSSRSGAVRGGRTVIGFWRLDARERGVDRWGASAIGGPGQGSVSLNGCGFIHLVPPRMAETADGPQSSALRAIRWS